MANATTKPARPPAKPRVRRSKPGTTTLYVWNIPAKTKTDFKAYCAKRGMSMAQCIIRFMDGFTLQKR